MIATNSPTISMTAIRANALNRAALSDSLTKLSTANKINRGADSPADLISSENLRAVLATLEAQTRVLQRVDSVATVAESALGEASDLLIEAKALAIANANTAALSPSERTANQMQIDSILSSVDRISRITKFNGVPLLDGTAALDAAGRTIQIDSVATAQIGKVQIEGQSYDLADVASGRTLNTVDGSVDGAVRAIQVAIGQIATSRGQIGAFQRHTVATTLNHLAVAAQNTAAANSIIRDTDFASETSRLARRQLLEQSSSTAMRLTHPLNANMLTLLGS